MPAWLGFGDEFQLRCIGANPRGHGGLVRSLRLECGDGAKRLIPDVAYALRGACESVGMAHGSTVQNLAAAIAAIVRPLCLRHDVTPQ